MFFKKRKAIQRVIEIFENYSTEEIVRDTSLLNEVESLVDKYSIKRIDLCSSGSFVEIGKLKYYKKIQKPIFEIADRIREDCVDVLRWVGDDGFGRDVGGFRLVDVEHDVEIVLYKLDNPRGSSCRFKNIKGNLTESEFLWRICKEKDIELKEKPLIEKREELTKIYCGE